VELDPQCVGDLIIPLGPRYQITKHLNLAVLAKAITFFGGCFGFKVLTVELNPQCMGDLKIPLGSQFQITKHLNLVLLFQRATFFCRCFEFEALKVEMASNA
jgi:hypothetical protein